MFRASLSYRPSTMKQQALALVTSVLLTALAGPALAQNKIAIVETQRVLHECNEGLKVAANLKKLSESRQAEIDTKQRQLVKEKETLEKDAQKLKQELLVKRYNALLDSNTALQALIIGFQREMAQKSVELNQPIFAKAHGAIERVAKGAGYDLVLERESAPYSPTGVDITDKVIALMNAEK
ncbi:MAG: OmpH family outer membrane protein [Myxococcota bacterium]